VDSGPVPCSLLKLFRDVGRWAQAKRRGGGPAGPSGPGPPPAPVFGIVGASVFIYPTGADDEGGQFEVERSPSGLGVWSHLVNVGWDPEAYFGEIDDLTGYDYRVAEIGNGAVYVGQSAWSPTLIL
jgi:hypothetical protein